VEEASDNLTWEPVEEDDEEQEQEENDWIAKMMNLSSRPSSL
jgi:hypothetical protein